MCFLISFCKIIKWSGWVDYAAGELIFMLLARDGEWAQIFKLYSGLSSNLFSPIIAHTGMERDGPGVV